MQESNDPASERSEFTPEMARAAEEIYDFLFRKLGRGGGVHVGTFVSAAARLAGTSLLRSFNLQLPEAEPGTPMLSMEANQEGPKLMELMLRALHALGVDLGGKIDPETPTEHLPEMGIVKMQETLEEGFREIMVRHNLGLAQAALAGAFSCAMIIRECREFLDPKISAGIAVMGFIEGTKTVPAPLKPGPPA